MRELLTPEGIRKAIEDRIPLGSLLETAAHKTVPLHRHHFWYYLGGISLFLFGVQAVSGILLLFHYQPGAESSYSSVLRIMTRVEFGWLIRSIHSWAANIMVLLVFAHMFSAFFMKAYRKPRELTWWSGIALLVLTLAFGFSGYLLPWDEVSYFATKVGLETPQATTQEIGEMVHHLPLLGKPLGDALIWAGRQGPYLLKGGEEITGLTIQRFFTLHVVILPWVFAAALGAHLLLIQLHGNAIPKSIEEKGEYREVPFFPTFLYSDVFMWLVTFTVLSTLAALAPWSLGEEADVLRPAPLGIHPEWYFMSQFQILKLVPEVLAFGLFTVGFALWALVPLWDPHTASGRRAKLATYFGILLVVGFILFTFWGYAGLES